MNDLQTTNTQATAMMDPAVMAGRVAKMKQLMTTVMRQDVHYGVIEGCQKPSLYLPGAQALKVAFGIATKYSVEDISVPGEKAFRVTAEVFDQQTGNVIGYGVGECSSAEEKYAWRKAICQEEYDATDPTSKRLKFKRAKGGGHYTEMQIRTNPADVSNTILKMATKRADVHGVINATAASDVFTQDVEDFPEGYISPDSGSSSTKPNVSSDSVSSSGPVSGSIVESVDVKTGTGKKGTWSRYGVRIGGKTYGTFDTKIGNLAASLKGKPVVFTFENDGKYDNLTSIAPTPAAASEPATVQDANDFAQAMAAIIHGASMTEKEALDVLFAEFGYSSWDAVPADQQEIVASHFSSKVYGA